MEAGVLQCAAPAGLQHLRDAHAGRLRQVRIERTGEGGEGLRQDQVVLAGTAAAGQPLGRPPGQIEGRGAGTHHDVPVDQSVVPEQLERSLPAGHGRHLVQQQEARPACARELQRAFDGGRESAGRLPLEEIQGQVDDGARLAPRFQRPPHEELEIGGLADLARPAQRVQAGGLDVEAGHEGRRELDRLGTQASQVGVGDGPVGGRPPWILPEQAAVCCHTLRTLAQER
jgi:hypothetical protein